ncbi:PPE family protein [Mycobacterium shigaense]|uniref:Putative PPE family protein PPE32 n=1 Tax=Mycobacterium shigaense TaxID=722731 RepID=A0A1Z4EH73_9MYCO|nr:PPE family protein [Mycobacterium shigaense]MEA1122956.1 PPE family protein [Mycobacterium shigaense]PRI13347.1 hypothetical protein B2J96_21415 [Mycobacterium shigaense]BAX92250.1 putative PPE family protein PPE32 [Mycobacterium shigaense]
MDFGALPPEINSGKIYAGPGPAPLLAAATAWDGLASELQATAASYRSVVMELTTGWHGPSAASMAAAAAPYVAWLGGTAAQAEQSALHAKAAAGAYEAAFAASVPPPVIAANRSLLELLIATNFLGLNSAAIAATEAEYAEMWAQDAAAMYAYAESAAAATALQPFTAPPKTTNDSGAAGQADAVAAAGRSSVASGVEKALSQTVSAAPLAAQSISANAVTTAAAGLPLSLTDITGILKTFTSVMGVVSGPYTPLGVANLMKNWYQIAGSIPNLGVGIQGIGPLLHPKPLLGVLAPLLRSDLLTGATALQGAGTVSAAAGRAGLVGSLSVPANWAAAVPAVRTLAAELPETMLDGAPAMAAGGTQGMFGPTALSSLGGRAVGGTATRAAARSAVRVPGAVAVDDIATTSTVIVIPPNAK